MVGPIVSPAGDSSPSTPPPLPGLDPLIVVEYLVRLLQTTLDASREDLEREGCLLSKSSLQETVQRCTRFAAESQVALYVQKDVLPDVLPPGGVNGAERSSGRWSCAN